MDTRMDNWRKSHHRNIDNAETSSTIRKGNVTFLSVLLLRDISTATAIYVKMALIVWRLAILAGVARKVILN